MLSVRVTANRQVAADHVPEPSPAPGQVVVEVHATSVNRGELALIESRGEGWSPGQDVAGTVVTAAADGSGPPVGTRVIGLAEQGAWSERVAVDATRLATVPDDVDLATAATLPMAGLTAIRTLRLLGSVVGRHVLITGASGGVGRFQTRLALLSGARVTALTRSADDIAGARMINSLDHAEPADVALDGVGLLRDVLAHLKPHSTLVWYGSTAGRSANLSIYDVVGHENVRILTYFSYAADPGHDVSDLSELLALTSSGDLVPEIAGTWPLDRAAEAVAHLTAGSVKGKLILTAGTSI